MRADIIDKLSRELSKGIDSEAQVLYLLVEIRKVRQSLPRATKTLLDFYRDWACHVELIHASAVGIFIDRFEPLVDKKLSAHQIASGFIKAFPNFFTLDELKGELKSFFVQEGLATDLIDNPKKWSVFAKLLLGILEDCSIKRPSSSSGLIRELTLKTDGDGNSKYKFHISGKSSPICKLKWK